MNAIATSADRYELYVASVNSLAMTAAIEYAGSRSDLLICGVFPITIVTAIVSPSALASARTIDPNIPLLAYGKEIFLSVSHRVAPSAYIPSFNGTGTVLSTSVDTDMMNGTIMIARIREAVRRPTPSAYPWKIGRNPNAFEGKARLSVPSAARGRRFPTVRI